MAQDPMQADPNDFPDYDVEWIEIHTLPLREPKRAMSSRARIIRHAGQIEESKYEATQDIPKLTDDVDLGSFHDNRLMIVYLCLCFTYDAVPLSREVDNREGVKYHFSSPYDSPDEESNVSELLQYDPPDPDEIEETQRILDTFFDAIRAKLRSNPTLGRLDSGMSSSSDDGYEDNFRSSGDSSESDSGSGSSPTDDAGSGSPSNYHTGDSSLSSSDTGDSSMSSGDTTGDSSSETDDDSTYEGFFDGSPSARSGKSPDDFTTSDSETDDELVGDESPAEQTRRRKSGMESSPYTSEGSGSGSASASPRRRRRKKHKRRKSHSRRKSRRGSPPTTHARGRSKTIEEDSELNDEDLMLSRLEEKRLSKDNLGIAHEDFGSSDSLDSDTMVRRSDSETEIDGSLTQMYTGSSDDVYGSSETNIYGGSSETLFPGDSGFGLKAPKVFKLVSKVQQSYAWQLIFRQRLRGAWEPWPDGEMMMNPEDPEEDFYCNLDWIDHCRDVTDEHRILFKINFPELPWGPDGEECPPFVFDQKSRPTDRECDDYCFYSGFHNRYEDEGGLTGVNPNLPSEEGGVFKFEDMIFGQTKEVYPNCLVGPMRDANGTTSFPVQCMEVWAAVPRLAGWPLFTNLLDCEATNIRQQMAVPVNKEKKFGLHTHYLAKGVLSLEQTNGSNYVKINPKKDLVGGNLTSNFSVCLWYSRAWHDQFFGLWGRATSGLRIHSENMQAGLQGLCVEVHVGNEKMEMGANIPDYGDRARDSDSLDAMFFHVVVTYDRQSRFIRLYVNNEQMDRQMYKGEMLWNADPIALGARLNRAEKPEKPMSGHLFDVFVYDKTLTAHQISSLYEAGRTRVDLFGYLIDNPNPLVELMRENRPRMVDHIHKLKDDNNEKKYGEDDEDTDSESDSDDDEPDTDQGTTGDLFENTDSEMEDGGITPSGRVTGVSSIDSNYGRLSQQEMEYNSDTDEETDDGGSPFDGLGP